MPGLALDAIRRSYGRARLRRQPWEPLWRECYAYALPQRGYGLGAEFGQARRYNETLFDGTAPDAVDQLSSSGDERTRWGSALAVEGLDGLVDGDVEGVGVTERAVGEVVALQVAPGPLDVVQLGRWVLSRGANPQPSQGIAPRRRLWPGPTATSTSTSAAPSSAWSRPAPRSARSRPGSAATRPPSIASWAGTASATAAAGSAATSR